VRVNQRQRERMVDKIVDALDGDVRGRTLGILGLSFKPETDDMREAPAVDIIQALLERGAHIRAYDPQAMPHAVKLLPSIVPCKDAYEACEDADALVIITEWNQFRMLDLRRAKELLRHPVVVDLRNIYEPASMRAAGFRYVCVGR
jgi:UDPglucose 6-dehydrogenase